MDLRKRSDVDYNYHKSIYPSRGSEKNNHKTYLSNNITRLEKINNFTQMTLIQCEIIPYQFSYSNYETVTIKTFL